MVTPMRKVILSDGSRFDVRPLTRGEIRTGKNLGLKYLGVKIDPDNFDDVLDYCLGCLFSDENIDNMPNLDQQAIFRAVIAETWGSRDEEKNSDPSGSGSQTANGSSTAGTAEKASVSA